MGTFGCEASPPRESHTLHPLGSTALGPSLEGEVGSGFPEAEGWVTIPFSAIQFSGSAVSEAVRPCRLSRRWGWVSSPPRGPCQAEVVSAFERDRTSFWVSRNLARNDGDGRHPWLGDYGAFRCRGPPKALSCRLFSPAFAALVRGPCPSRVVDATDPWAGSKRFSLESSKTLQLREFEVADGCLARAAQPRTRRAPGPRSQNRIDRVRDLPLRRTAIAPNGLCFEPKRRVLGRRLRSVRLDR